MELLQTIQYYYVNQCDNKTNVFLTEIAYILVVVQPLLWNVFFYLNSNKCERKIFQAAILLAIVWIILNVTSRILYKPSNALSSDVSIFSSDKVCTKKQLTHLYWEWTFANLGNFNANFVTYLMIWFIPALVSSQYMASVILILSAIFGAFMVHFLKEPFTFTSSWCYISVPIVIIVMLHILVKQT